MGWLSPDRFQFVNVNVNIVRARIDFLRSQTVRQTELPVELSRRCRILFLPGEKLTFGFQGSRDCLVGTFEVQ